MGKIYKTKIDEDGNLMLAGSKAVKSLEIVSLQEDPFRWVRTIVKDTANLNEGFVKKFLSDNGLNYDKIASIRSWFPFYYAAFLMEVSNSIEELGIKRLKQDIAYKFQERNALTKTTKAIIDCIPNALNGKSEVGMISDCFNRFTEYDCMFFLAV